MKNRKSTIAAVLAMTVVAGVLAFSPMDVRAAETFDPVFYAETYADVAAAFGTDANALYNHYVNYGRYEGRKAYAGAVGGEEVSSAVNGVMQVTVLPEFDPVFYAETYPDIVAVLGTDANALYNHYINCGRSEGRKAYAGAVGGEEVSSAVNGVMQVTVLPKFDPVFYAETYPDVVAEYFVGVLSDVQSQLRAAGYVDVSNVEVPVDRNPDHVYREYINYGRYEGRKPYAGAVGGEAVLPDSASNRIVKITDISNTELSQYNTHEWYDLGDSFVYITEDKFDQPNWADELGYASILDERYPNGNFMENIGGGFLLVDGRFAYYAYAATNVCPNLLNFMNKY